MIMIVELHNQNNEIWSDFILFVLLSCFELKIS